MWFIYIIDDIYFKDNNISSIIYQYYILDEFTTMYTLNREFSALKRWELLWMIGLDKTIWRYQTIEPESPFLLDYSI